MGLDTCFALSMPTLLAVKNTSKKLVRFKRQGSINGFIREYSYES